MTTPNRELWGKTGAAFVALLARAWPVLTANPRGDESGEITIKVKITHVPRGTNGAAPGPPIPDWRIELVPGAAKAPKGISLQLEAIVIGDQLTLFEPGLQQAVEPVKDLGPQWTEGPDV